MATIDPPRSDPECHPDPWLRGLPAPVKSRYFYGQLLSERSLSREQHYLDGKRWLLNRLALGKGVLSGLGFRVDLSDAGGGEGSRWRVKLDPGVAVDGFGREIVVPAPRGDGRADEAAAPEVAALDVHGHPVGAHEAESFLRELFRGAGASDTLDAVHAGTAGAINLLLWVAYRAEKADPVPVRAGDCPGACDYGARREAYVTRVTLFRGPLPDGGSAPDEEPTRDSPLWRGGALHDVFPAEPPELVRHRERAQLQQGLEPQAAPFSAAGVDTHALTEQLRWVEVGALTLTVTWGGSPGTPRVAGLAFDNFRRYRHQVFSNDSLSRLLFGLAERVDEAARVRVATFRTTAVDGKVLVAADPGETQQADVYHTLPKPLAVQVLSGQADGVPLPTPEVLANLKVRFELLTPRGGLLFPGEDAARDRTAYDHRDDLVLEKRRVEVPVGANGLARVWWRLGSRSGLNTVSARLVPRTAEERPDPNPPFHPGSQVVFHATARPTAPTVVGIEFCGYAKANNCHEPVWRPGELRARVYFSRQPVEAELLDNLNDVVRVIAVRRLQSELVSPPRRLSIDQYELKRVGPGEDAPWRLDCKLDGFYTDLCSTDVVRLVVLARVPSGDIENYFQHRPATLLLSADSTSYPTPQVFDLRLDGSYLSPAYFATLFESASPPTGDDPEWADVGALRASSTTQLVGKELEQHLDNHHAFWERFRPRDRDFPGNLGDEVEGLFHKTFEIELPCCCRHEPHKHRRGDEAR
jgi:hypothetical protein